MHLSTLVLAAKAARAHPGPSRVHPGRVPRGQRFVRRAGGLRRFRSGVRPVTFVMHSFIDADDVAPAWEQLQRGETSDVPRIRAAEERLQACAYSMGHPETGAVVPRACSTRCSTPTPTASSSSCCRSVGADTPMLDLRLRPAKDRMLATGRPVRRPARRTSRRHRGIARGDPRRRRLAAAGPAPGGAGGVAAAAGSSTGSTARWPDCGARRRTSAATSTCWPTPSATPPSRSVSPLGVDDRATWIAVAVLLGLFFVNAISWSYLAAVLEKRARGLEPPARPRR